MADTTPINVDPLRASSLVYQVSNKEKWSQPLNPATSTIQEMNAFTKYKVTEYAELLLKDDDLWETFKIEIERFKTKDFDKYATGIITYLRNFLRKNGV